MSNETAEFIALTVGLLTICFLFFGGLGWHEHGWKGALANVLWGGKILGIMFAVIAAGVFAGIGTYRLFT